MAKDLIYSFTKDTFYGTEYGEVQCNFNMSLVIDGTKDSCKIEVLNFDSEELEPFTLLWHENSNSWWIVSHDNVGRLPNESGYLYKHNLQLLGAIELLNARDYIDSGYNQNRYTIDTFLKRVFKLSNFEFNKDDLEIEYNDCLSPNKKVDYIKTFENYTLLSVLTEFLDSYNSSCKLRFDIIDFPTFEEYSQTTNTINAGTYIINEIELSRALTITGKAVLMHYTNWIVDETQALSTGDAVNITTSGELNIYHGISLYKTYQQELDYDNGTFFVLSFVNNQSGNIRQMFVYKQVGISGYQISKAILDIIPKTGFISDPLNENVFNVVNENKTIDKNSFGTTVISNAENVISTKAKTFPSVGYARLTGNAYEITQDNAMFRLPSNINKINWVEISYPLDLIVAGQSIRINSFDDLSIEDMIDRIAKMVTDDLLTGSSLRYEDVKEVLEENKNAIFDIAELGSKVRLYSGWQFNPVNANLIPPNNNPNFYFPAIIRRYANQGLNFQASWLVGSKDEHDNITSTQRCIYYERGKNYLTGFNILANPGSVSPSDFSKIRGYEDTLLRDDYYNPYGSTPINYVYYWQHDFTYTIQGQAGERTYELKIALGELPLISVSNIKLKVNYVPMTNLKIKYDNSGFRRDSQLFNQTGKLTDSVGLSKRLLSYSKEIESNNIVKNGVYYSFESIPKVGQTITINNDKYVINSCSINFNQNENGYYYDCEFSLSKNIAVKSLMVNPNTNIRDYGIPQNNNVVRKQLYRDFYELEHVVDSRSDTNYYLPLQKVLNLGYEYNDFQEHIGVIKLTFEEAYGSSGNEKNTWYYQLDTTTYIMKKAIYEVVNFNDNNIIGYGSQNAVSDFDVSRLFSGLIDVKNTPISYTDYNGEVKGIYIAMTSIDNLIYIYDNLKVNSGYGSSSKQIYNYSVFIDPKIYEGSDTGYSTIYDGIIWGIWIETERKSIDITSYIPNYTGEASDLSFGSIRIISQTMSELTLNTDYTCSFSKINNSYYIIITPLTTAGLTATYYEVTDIRRAGYYGAKDLCDFEIVEEEYYKDALEVPVFEYSCQIDDSKDVTIGENIFDTTSETIFYLYSYVLVPKNVVDENNFQNYVELPIVETNALNQREIVANNSVEMSISGQDLLIGFKEETKYNIITNEITVGDSVPLLPMEFELQKHDILIVRHKVNQNTQVETIDNVMYAKSDNDLMFVIRNTNRANIDSFNITLKINHYKIN